MERLPVSSSNIAAVGYESATETLEVEFLSGVVYEYKNVPDVVHEQFVNASSLGSFFNREIRKVYAYEKIG